MDKYVVVAATSTNEDVKVINKLHIPHDLGFSILSKLPLKSLKRFECVCKSWALLFESPHFLSVYRNNFLSKDDFYYDGASILLHQTIDPAFNSYYHEQTYALYSLSGEKFENKVKLDWPNPFPEDDHGFNLWGSGCVNGILCLLCRWQENIVLWTPATKEFKVIPPSPIDSVPYWEVWGGSARGFGYDCVRDDYKVFRRVTFHPRTTRDIDEMPWEDDDDGHRFGYDHIRDDYKVTRRVEFISKNNYDLDGLPGEDVFEEQYISYDSFWEMYSLRNNSWTKLDLDMPLSYDDQEVYMNGMCHWWCKSETHNKAYLVSFDLGNVVFFTTSIPSDTDDSFDFLLAWRHLVVLNGFIALILNYTETNTFHILILGELGVMRSWTKLFIVGPLHCVEYPIGAGKKGNILFRKEDGELIWFDLSTQMIEKFGVIVERSYSKILIYKENLLPLRGIE